MDIPQGFASQRGSNKVCKLHKSIYVLKQAPRQWNRKLTDPLLHLGSTRRHFDYSLYTKHIHDKLVIVLGYADDLLVIGSCNDLILKTINDLKLKFKMKDLGEIKFFLGIEFVRSDKEIVMSQRKYALEQITKMALGGAKPAGAPLKINLKLTFDKYDCFDNNDDKTEDKLLTNAVSYQRLLGACQFLHKLKQSHIEPALRVVIYIKVAPGLDLLMPSEGSEKLQTLCNSDYGGCLQSRRYVTRYLLRLGNVLVSWNSKKQDMLLEAQQ
ncbi:PREDICTED: uncharacterized protein LOC109243826 [Nicotiana attenuata]|uniref:uncharacterized protein LOC109243826 n=1 Tax=Nicotiana attenuata TaxID=49451 RepID=UPI0009047E26|nr:PREDICTED: uncharacterized protein LOC109243826 [Nicotiana attenuata]